MEHSFNIIHAQQYGVNEAIMIKNMQFWLVKNKANQTNFYDNHYWTYNSKKAFTELFPYWTERQIKTILDSLISQGVLIKGCYNINPYDRTLWYAFNDESTFLNCSIDWTKKSNVEQTKKSNLTDKKVQSNTDNKLTYSRTDSKLTDTEEEKEKPPAAAEVPDFVKANRDTVKPKPVITKEQLKADLLENEYCRRSANQNGVKANYELFVDDFIFEKFGLGENTKWQDLSDARSHFSRWIPYHKKPNSIITENGRKQQSNVIL